jgi:hypothetical protein
MTIEAEYKSFLSNKRVALVGPAKSISNIKQGKYIDSFDVVVRLNNMLEVPNHLKETIGSRTDVIYSTIDDKIADLSSAALKNSIKFISTSYPSNEWFFRNRMQANLNTLRMMPFFKTTVLPAEPYYTIKKETNSRPNTGFSAIIDLLNSDIKELFITGVDFYRSTVEGTGEGYIDGYECQWTGLKKTQFLPRNIQRDGPDVHNPDSSFIYFKYNMFKRDGRIKVDSGFEKYLNDERYENLNNFYTEGEE